MKIELKHALEDYAEGRRAYAHINPTPRRRQHRTLFLSTLMLVAAITAVWLVSEVWYLMIAVAGIAIQQLVAPYLQKRKWVQSTSKNATAVSIQGSADEKHLVFPSETYDSVMKWSYFNGWMETENLFLLLIGDESFTVIPKRSFPTNQIDEFRNLLHDHLTYKTPCKSNKA